jgi:hypothetical protein
MPRTPRHSFPFVHSLYLSAEQDRDLRKYAKRAERTVSDVMREALDAYLAQERVRKHYSDDVPVEVTRFAIAESVRRRKLGRGPKRAQVLPHQIISADAIVWQPPPGLRAPASDRHYRARDNPMAVDRDGNPIEPPANAIAWRVLVRRHPDGRVAEYLHRGQPLVVDLTIKHHEFAHAVHHQDAAFYLQPIDEFGRVLRFIEIYVPLGRAVDWDYY